MNIDTRTRRALAATASLATVVLLAVAGLSLASAPSPTSAAATAAAAAEPPAAEAAVDTDAASVLTPGSTLIVARNFEFIPANATTLDDWVTFVNVGPSTHRPIADDDCFDAGFMSVGSTSAVDVSGCPDATAYHCSIHPSMEGVVTKV